MCGVAGRFAVQGPLLGEAILPGKDRLWSIVSMLDRLDQANSDYRPHDGTKQEKAITITITITFTIRQAKEAEKSEMRT